MVSLDSKLEVLRVISHPVRIKILEELSLGVKCVSDFEEFLDISQPNVSQHLSLMRKMGVIDYFVDGRLRCYFIVDSMVPDLLELLKKDHGKPVPPPTCCPVTKKGKYPGKQVCA
jgi:ArsR family transcriptional regulator